jgi:hypothetical protein
MTANVRILPVLLVLIVAQLVAGVAIASKDDALVESLPNMSCALTPTGIEPDASGQAKLTNATCYWFEYPPNSVGTLSLTCKGLTPNTQYSTSVGLVTTEARGRLRASGTYAFNWPGSIWVVVCNADGDIVLEGLL